MEEKKDDMKHQTGAFDELLVKIGEFGRYQRCIYLLLCLPGISCALHKLAWVFLGAQADHRCLLPHESAHNASFPLPPGVANLSLPWSAVRGAWSQCEHLDADFSSEYFAAGVPEDRTVACTDFVFDHSVYTSSAVMEFQLVCGDAWARAAVDTLVMFGDLSGSIVFGNLSDRFGRRPVFFSALVLQVSVGILASLAPTFLTFILARFVVGATIPGVYIVAYVLGMEMVGPSKRQYAGITLQIFFSVGYMLTALFAFLIDDWRDLQLALSVPGLFFLVYWWVIPESPRWLVGQGHVAEASLVLQRAARVNKSDVTPASLDKSLGGVADKLQREAERSNMGKPSLLQVCKFPALRRNTAIIFFIWFVNNLAYFGLSLNTGNLGGDHYVNFVISGAVEIPAYLLVMFSVNHAGRKPVQCASMLVGAAALLLTAAVPASLPWLLTTLAMVGKMAVTASCGTAYVLSAEIFPTSIRNAGLGAASTLAGVGAMIAPFIILLANLWRQLPFFLLGCCALLAGLLSLLLPETLNRDLPETIEDGEAFSRSAGKYKSAPIDVKL